MGNNIEPSGLTEGLTLLWKLFRRNYLPIATKSFCKKCGRYNRDFEAPNWVWREIEGDISHGNVLCFDCFHEVCHERFGYTVWRIYGKQ